MKAIFSLYKNAYSGLSHPAWMLALVILINRSGTMVLPFMSLYLSEALHFSFEQTGTILSLFGLGSMTGAFLGGWLTDRVGHFHVQFFSLVIGGCGFYILSFITEFHHLAFAVLIISIISESLRPANASSVAHYAKPENITRAFSLNRMAINLGFTFGPALGGFLASISFRLIFIADALTCIGAGIVFYFYFYKRKSNPVPEQQQIDSQAISPYRDFRFLAFVALTCTFAMVFFQFMSTLPLYYRDIYHLQESKIGLLLGTNGLTVFVVEMVLVYILGKRFRISSIIVIGTLLNGFSFIILNLFPGVPILFLAMILFSLAEILVIPFLATHTTRVSDPKRRGSYMGLYGFSYSFAMVLAPYLGMQIIDTWGYEMLWWSAGILSLFTAAGYYFVIHKPSGKLISKTSTL